MLTTKKKIALATLAQRWIMATRSLMGRGALAEVSRRGVRWKLDLREGIDFSIWLFGAFEIRTVRAYERIIKPDDIVLDVGANIGAHTLYMAKAAGPGGKVYAFEPTEFALSKLKLNIAVNPSLAGRIVCAQIMLVDHVDNDKVPPLYSSWPLGDAVGVHALHRGRLMSTNNARPMTLDSYVGEAGIERVNFIKLDIDGSECRMLRGAREVLQRYRPTILLELSPHQLAESGCSIDELTALLAEAKYRLYDFRLRSLLPMSGTELRARIQHGGSENAIARPV